MLEFFKTGLDHKELLWSIKAFFIIFTALVAGMSLNVFIIRLEKKLTRNKNIWDDLLLRSIRKPLKVLIWILGIIFVGKVTGDYMSADLSKAIFLLKNLGIIFCIGWFLWRVVSEYETHLVNGDKNIDITTVTAVMKLIKATIAITITLMVLQTLGVNISGIIAFGGIGGMVIGFAAKDLLANFFGAMMIYLDRPFVVGDWVRSPDREIEGTIESIGWRLTHIRTFESRMLYVPNSVFSTISIENPSRMKNRRIYETIGVRYKDMDKVAKITNDIKEMLNKHDEINQNATLMVYLNKLDQYSVDFFIYCFTNTAQWSKYHEVKQDVLLKISDIVDKNGGEIAFPTSVIGVDGAISIENLTNSTN
jgi:MscS family membrane protein